VRAGVGDEGTEDGGAGDPEATASLPETASAEPSAGAVPVGE